MIPQAAAVTATSARITPIAMSHGRRLVEEVAIGVIGAVWSAPPMSWVRSPALITAGAMTAWPRAARMRSSRISPAEWYRFSGFFASAFMITASTVSGMFGLSSEGGRASSRTCW